MSEQTPPDPTVLRIERTFNAPAQAVFDAWTSVEVLRRWWPAGADWDTPSAEVDLRIGGALRVFTWTWDEHVGYEGSQLVEVDFIEHSDGTTTVVLTNSGLRDDKSRRDHEEGWQASFDNLDLVFISRP